MSETNEKSASAVVKKAPVRQERWYFGGLAGVLAACCTHPLDTIKVQLQTQQRADYGLVCKQSLRLSGQSPLDSPDVSSDGRESDP